MVHDYFTVTADDYNRELPAVRDWLIGMACKRRSVRYGDVMSAFNLGHRNLRRAMSLLGRESGQRGEPIITALIVSKTTGRCSDGIEKECDVLDDAAEPSTISSSTVSRGLHRRRAVLASHFW